MKKCIICNEREATTSEHKILKCLYSYFNPNNDLMGYIKDINNLDNFKLIQGSKSKFLKFNKNLCADCNGSLTQKHDNSFEKLIKSIDNDLTNNGYSKYTLKEDDNVNVAKYLLKIMICRIDNLGYNIPEGMKYFILHGNYDYYMDNIKIVISGSSYDRFFHPGLLNYYENKICWALEDYCIGKLRFDIYFHHELK
jgi:hypothetical protein